MWLLDLGNTALKAAWWQGQTLHRHAPILHRNNPEILQAELAALLAQKKTSGGRFCSVVRPELTSVIAAMSGLQRLQSRREQSGLINVYEDVSKLGDDRWAVMLGAWQQHREAFCVVDVGTAVTIDFVDRDGRHLGGYILPGQMTMLHGLMSATTLQSELAMPAQFLPANNTEEAIHNGVGLAVVGAIKSAMNTLSTPMTHYLLTGGGASQLTKHLPDFTLDQDLVFKGLMVAA